MLTHRNYTDNMSEIDTSTHTECVLSELDTCTHTGETQVMCTDCLTYIHVHTADILCTELIRYKYISRCNTGNYY